MAALWRESSVSGLPAAIRAECDMLRTMRLGWGGLLCAFASTAFGEQVSAPTSPQTVFRTSTKLVQVSVIVQDKRGKPIPDVQRTEFQIFDNGSPRNIQLFLAETEKPNLVTAPETKAPNTFTNQIPSDAGSHSGYSVILIDNLFTIFGDPDVEPGGSALARVQALRTLRSGALGRKTAIYAVGRKLTVICEFTSDRDLLERQLAAWRPAVDAPTAGGQISGDPLHPQPDDDMSKALADAARIDALQRASSSDAEMGRVADHLAGIPGRKNLIWLSTRFVIGPATLRNFSEANVAIYPVDLDGVCYPPRDGVGGIPCPWPRPKELMNSIAAQTGGLAFYARNDLDIAMREAMDDGRVSYTLGFYQPGEEDQATVHRLRVRVSRPGVTLRYRTTYRTETRKPESGANPVADLVEAMNRPVDATVVPITASAVRVQDRLDLKFSFDVSSLGLELREGRWKGKAELVARFGTADGAQAGDVVAQTATFNLKPTTYASMLQSGFPYHKELKIPAKAAELKLLVGNPASRKIGTLTIPLSQVGSQPQDPIEVPRR